MNENIKIKNKYKDMKERGTNNVDDIMKQFGKIGFIIKLIEIFSKISGIYSKCLKKYTLLLSFLAGLLSYPAFHKEVSSFYFLSVFLFYGILEYLRINNRTKKFFFAGFFYGVGLYSHSFFWLTKLDGFGFKSVSVDQFMGTFSFLGCTFWLALHVGLSSYFASKFAYSKISLYIFFTLIMTTIELSSNYVINLSPLQCLANGCIGMTYFQQIGSIFGTFGVSMMFLSIIALLKTSGFRKKGLYLYFFSCLYGFYKIKIKNNYKIPDEKFTVRVVQPNFKGWAKYRYAKPCCDDIAVLANVDNIKNLDHKLMIITPETVINEYENELDYFTKRVCGLIKNNGDLDNVIIPDNLKDKECNIIACTGFYQYRGPEQYHNTYKFFTYDYKNNESVIADYYDKKYLIPFGETLPNWFIKFTKTCIPQKFTSIHNFVKEFIDDMCYPGRKTNTMFIKGVSPFSMNICSDIFVPGKTIDDNRSTWILSTVNYYMFNAGNVTYLATLGQQFGRFRAIEYNRPVVMSINFGYSCVIDCNGKVLKYIDPRDQGCLDYEMPLKYDISLFSYWNYYFLKLIILILFIFTFYSRPDRKIKILKKIADYKFGKDK